MVRNRLASIDIPDLLASMDITPEPPPSSSAPQGAVEPTKPPRQEGRRAITGTEEFLMVRNRLANTVIPPVIPPSSSAPQGAPVSTKSLRRTNDCEPGEKDENAGKTKQKGES